MKNKLLISVIFISLGLLISSVNAQVTTDLLFNDTDTLAGGYYVRYQYDVDNSDSSIRVDIDASQPIDFGICDGGDMEDWQNGGSEPSWYVYRTNVTLNTITTLLNRGTYDFVLKQPPASELLKKAAGIEKGSGEPNRTKIAKISKTQLQEIAKKKMPDLNTDDIEQAMKIIEGTARNMGITIE